MRDTIPGSRTGTTRAFAEAIISTTPDMPDALCLKDPDAWFTEKAAGVTNAKSVCLACPHLVACREWGKRDDAPEHGVIGGLSAEERAAHRQGKRANVSRADLERLVLTTISRRRHGVTSSEIAPYINRTLGYVTDVARSLAHRGYVTSERPHAGAPFQHTITPAGMAWLKESA